MLKFLNNLIEILQKDILTIARKLNSLTVFVWLLVLYCRIRYGETWNEITVIATLALVGRRISDQMITAKNGNGDGKIVGPGE